MKLFWVEVKDKETATAAIEAGASLFVESDEEKFKKLGRVKIIDKNSCYYLKIRKKDDLSKIPEGFKYIIVEAEDWKIIPLENLIAEFQSKDTKLIAVARDYNEAKTFLHTLEVGVDGILLKSKNIDEIKKVGKLIYNSKDKITLEEAEIIEIKPLGMGDRVCVDTANILNVGEGMLVGSQSNGLFLVHSESISTEYAAARPFRVNAGAVHAYILIPNGKTKYLSELEAGDEVLIVDYKGNTKVAIIGRVKIEKRPLILIIAKSNNKTYKTLLQNAETIMLVKKDGKPISISKLKKGDKILIYKKEKARHFGIEIEESIIEK